VPDDITFSAPRASAAVADSDRIRVTVPIQDFHQGIERALQLYWALEQQRRAVAAVGVH
jgi:hypothetical protein